MQSASGSFEDFMVEFKKRHPREFGLDSGGSVAVKAPMAKIAEKAPEKAESVKTVAVVDDGWDAAEEVEVEENDNEKPEYWNL